MLISISKEDMAAVFTEWQRQFLADPEGFFTHEEADAQEPQTYGQGCASTFLSIAQEIGKVEVLAP